MQHVLAIKGGKIYTITKGVIAEGNILIEDGKIKSVGKSVKVPEGVEIIDAVSANKMLSLGHRLNTENAGRPYAIAFAPDGNTLVAGWGSYRHFGESTGGILVWNTQQESTVGRERE